MSLRDLREMVGFEGFRILARAQLATGFREFPNSLWKRRYLALCRRYCPN